MRFGAIVLSGGRSLRMGQDKSRLPVQNETLLQRVLNRTRAGLL
ncbi:MAG: molybdenum cofactor guanylyltransferase, partial [Planctomycetaceae bacterium]